MVASTAARSTSYAPAASSAEPDLLLGSTLPRIWTPELRPLTPETSYGFDLIDFAADVLGEPFDPWQEWLSIHAGELLPDGRPRFRKLLILVSRQNGKTHWAKALVKYWLFVERVPTILGTSTDRSYAKRTWQQIVEESKDNPWLAEKIGPKSERKTIGEETFVTLDKAEYTFAANNKRAGRSMTLHKWLCDEVREHTDQDTWNAASKAQNAVATAQTVCISNQGDDGAVVLDMLHKPALKYIETGEGDPRLGLFEWSGPKGCEPDDPQALAQANPNLNRPGHGPELEVLIADGRRAKEAGGLELTGFRTEVLCQRVTLMDPAIDPGAWTRRLEAGSLDDARDRVATVLDVSLDQLHATLYAAAVMPDGKTRIDFVKEWEGQGCADTAVRELPALLAKVKPKMFAWLPAGPAAAHAADLTDRKRPGWPPRGVKVDEIRGEISSVCMGFEQLVVAGQLLHSGDPLLDAQVESAQRARRGDTWVFSRRDSGHCDALYAAAGAAWLARTMPPPVRPLVLVGRVPDA